MRSNAEHGCDGPRNRTASFSKPGIPWDATEKQIRNDFGEGECGEIEAETQPEHRGTCARRHVTSKDLNVEIENQA